MMKFNITIEDIRSKNSYYDPTKHLPENWSGTLLDILDHSKAPDKDKVWVVTKFLDDKTARLFAVWCAREALKLAKEPDPRSVAACDVAERYALGEVTLDELNTAYAAAYAAAAAAAHAAAAYAAAAYAAYAAAAAAVDAGADADADAYAAAAAAAHAAAAAAASAAAYAAAAYAAAAYAAARLSQVKKLKEMIINQRRLLEIR